MDVASQNASQVAIELIEEGWEIEAELPVCSASCDECSSIDGAVESGCNQHD